MKKLILTTLSIVIALFATGPAYAADSTSASASATLISAISISKTLDMNFGKVVPNASATKTVILATNSGRSGTATLGNGLGVAASFAVSGDPNATYTVTLPASAASIDTTPTSGAPMDVDTWVSNPADTAGAGLLDGSGAQTLLVGATLHVGAAQPTGSYTGSFNVSVAYN